MDLVLIVFYVWHIFFFLFGLITNTLLIYLCIFHSPKPIRVYRTFIINFAITYLFECLVDIFLGLRCIPIPMEAKMAYQYNGLCQFVGLEACKYGTSMFNHCIPHGYWSLLLSFSYRYYVLKHRNIDQKHVTCAILFIYIPSFIQMLSLPENFWDLQPALDLIHEKFPDYNVSNTIVSACDMMGSASAFFGTCYTLLPVYPVYIGIFILRRKIIKGLMANKNQLSRETKSMHSQMLKCLTYQTIIPVLLVITVGLYIVLQLGIVNNREIELTLLSLYLLMPVLSSLTYLFFVRPYREFCQRVFCNKIPKTVVQTRSNKKGKLQSSTVQC